MRGGPAGWGRAAVLAAVWLACGSGRAEADAPTVRLGDIPLALRKQVHGVAFVLQGAGFLRWGYVFKVYGAALYVRDPADADRILEDVPKRLEILYLHHTPREKMIETADATLARNLTAEELAAVRKDVERLHAAYEDRKPGDVAALTYVPGLGTELAVNGARRVLIEGSAFAAAYFGVWLGEQPSSLTVKAQLLRPYRPEVERRP
ncbi:MAG: chalcone isomerase family protein [Lentisphaerae bacterium]|nr:chalcone isomerase family protein [Lentisphaerota bacterium]